MNEYMLNELQLLACKAKMQERLHDFFHLSTETFMWGHPTENKITKNRKMNNKKGLDLREYK